MTAEQLSIDAALAGMYERSAERLKQQGMERAARAAEAWSGMAAAQIERWAHDGLTFDADDLVATVGLPKGTEVAGGNNAVGAALAGASARGLIYPVGYTKSRRRAGHARVIRVWRGVGRG